MSVVRVGGGGGKGLGVGERECGGWQGEGVW